MSGKFRSPPIKYTRSSALGLNKLCAVELMLLWPLPQELAQCFDQLLVLLCCAYRDAQLVI